ncbi:MAG TPA: hypothetical protein VF171_08970, partial [Trueperaceae bacterium]
MIERLSVATLAVLTLLALWLAPWATLSREIGADGAVLLLPNRIVDFTGDVSDLHVPAQALTLVLAAVALAAVAGAGALRQRARYAVWLIAGLVLVGATTFGLSQVQQTLDAARGDAIVHLIERAIERPRANTDVDALHSLLDQAPELSDGELVSAAQAAGVRVRRLPYQGSGPNLAAFLSLVTGGLAVLFGLRSWPQSSRLIDRLIAGAAVPVSSTLLALLAAAVVILLLQATPHDAEVVIHGWFMALVGRLDTLWYAYE